MLLTKSENNDNYLDYYNVNEFLFGIPVWSQYVNMSEYIQFISNDSMEYKVESA